MDFVELLRARKPQLHQNVTRLIALAGALARVLWTRHLAPAVFGRPFAEFSVGALCVCVFALLGCL